MCNPTDFSAVSKPIALRMRVKGSGPITYVADPQSDEESTEMAMPDVKVTPAPLPVHEDVWFLLNQDFSMEGGHSDELYCPVKPAPKSIERASSLEETTPIDDDEWMAMNEDFAQESQIEVEEEPVQVRAQTQVEASEEGDYGLWWEAPLIHKEDFEKMNRDFAVEGGQVDEDCCPNKAKSVERVGSQEATPMEENEWMAMNEDFALDNHIEVEEPERMQAMTQVEAAEEGEYGVWWE